MFTLYYWPGYCSLATHIVLNWAGADYALIKANTEIRNSHDFRMLNPSGTVPVLKIHNKGEEWTLSQNIAILYWLAGEYPETKLLGDASPQSTACVLRWLGYINSDVHKTFTPLLHPERVPGSAEVRMEVEKQALASLSHHLSILNDTMGNSLWLVEQRRSVADPYLFVILRWARMLGINLSEYASLYRFYKHMGTDESVTAALQQEGINLI